MGLSHQRAFKRQNFKWRVDLALCQVMSCDWHLFDIVTFVRRIEPIQSSNFMREPEVFQFSWCSRKFIFKSFFDENIATQMLKLLMGLQDEI